MSAEPIHQCQCPTCQQPEEHPDKELHHQMNLLITGMHVDTIRRGRRELDGELQDRPTERVRLSGGGRPPIEKKQQVSKQH